MAKSKESFEELMAALEAKATALEEGKIGLEDAVAEYEAAMKIKQRCLAILSSAEARIQQLQLAADGTLEAGQFDEAGGEVESADDEATQ